ncbi:hypothetical protein [Sphingobacterium luzhongxinii]|uniref:hypothetical protein n=1 Tax=Sphingobacterium luzhongxinii TaxID=2654181 RepID=UPI0013DB707C|nr:hypothetical protein [Sphingobacterium sp. xlx-73]
METIKRNWLKAITGVSLLLGLILVVNAFEKKTEIKPEAPQSLKTVYFVPSSNQDADIQNQGNWSDTPAPGQKCEGLDYLCQVQYDETMYPTLTHFLTANPTRAAIESNAATVSFKD